MNTKDLTMNDIKPEVTEEREPERRVIKGFIEVIRDRGEHGARKILICIDVIEAICEKENGQSYLVFKDSPKGLDLLDSYDELVERMYEESLV